MRCPKCYKGRLVSIPPPEASIDELPMYYCDRMDCKYMGDGTPFTSPEDRREQWENLSHRQKSRSDLRR